MPQMVTSAGSLGATIEQNEINTAIRYGFIPIGCPLPFLKNLTGTPSLPTGWVELNGQTISDADSAYNGVALPDLNSTNLFLRGAATSGGTGGGTAHTHGFTVPTSGTGPSNKIMGGNTTSQYYEVSGTTGSGSNLPPYYETVWVMRIK